MKIMCYGVRDYEISIFKRIETLLNHELVLNEKYLDDSNYESALGYETLIIRGNCKVSDQNLEKLRDAGLKYLLTRTAGYDHIPVEKCKELGIKAAYAPGYSPASIAELAVALGMSLLRDIPEAIMDSAKCDFTLNSRMFGREVRSCMVGIIGCGRIGKETAKLYKALGAKVLGTDPVQDEKMKGIIEYCSLDDLLSRADIISIHMSYIPGVNDHIIGKEEFKKMKYGAVLINTSRGELVDTEALIESIELGRLMRAGLDVIEDEKKVFFKQNESTQLPSVIQRAVALYPRIIMTPHMSSSTDIAVLDSLTITINNLNQLILKGYCDNSLS